MIELEQKPLNGSDFRVKECDGIFEIQRREVKKITTGYLWCKKTKEETNWKFVDKFGNCLWSHKLRAFYGYVTVDNYKEKINSFTDLQSAFDKIDIIITGEKLAKYHY